MSDRTRGTLVRTVPVSATVHPSYAYAMATVGADTYVICSEGVGWKVTADEPLIVDTLLGTHVMTVDEVREAAEHGTDVDLADHVRTFGSRLESNFWGWHARLNSAMPARKFPEPTKRELFAIDAIYSAMMACNSADEPLARGYEPHHTFVRLAEAGRAAWRQIGFTPREAAYRWWIMCDGASGAEYAHEYAIENPPRTGWTYR